MKILCSCLLAASAAVSFAQTPGRGGGAVATKQFSPEVDISQNPAHGYLGATWLAFGWRAVAMTEAIRLRPDRITMAQAEALSAATQAERSSTNMGENVTAKALIAYASNVTVDQDNAVHPIPKARKTGMADTELCRVALVKILEAGKTTGRILDCEEVKH